MHRMFSIAIAASCNLAIFKKYMCNENIAIYHCSWEAPLTEFFLSVPTENGKVPSNNLFQYIFSYIPNYETSDASISRHQLENQKSTHFQLFFNNNSLT